jgi:hypothetical protein
MHEGKLPSPIPKSTSKSTSEKSEPHGSSAPERKSRPRDPVWDALIDQGAPPPFNKPERDRINAAVKFIKEALTEGEVPPAEWYDETTRRCSRLIQAWGRDKFTPHAVAHNWSRFVDDSLVVSANRERRRGMTNEQIMAVEHTWDREPGQGAG